MRRKNFAVLLILCYGLLSLAGCKKQDVSVTNPTKESVAFTATVVPTSTEKVEPTVVIEPDMEPTFEVVPTEEPIVIVTATAEPTNTPTPEPTATAEPTNTPTLEPTLIPTNTPTPAPTSTPKPTATPKPTSTPKPIPTAVSEKKDSRFEDGMAKVMKLIDAYDDLLKYGGQCEYMAQTDLEMLSNLCSENIEVKTKDGKLLTDRAAWRAVGAMYYFNYVNNNTGYYDFETWIENQKNQETIAGMLFCHLASGSIPDTNDCLMFEAPALINWFKQADYIKGYGFEETDRYSVTGEKCAYIIKLDVDGDKTCTAVFAKNHALLNIVTSDSFDENNYIPSNLLN